MSWLTTNIGAQIDDRFRGKTEIVQVRGSTNEFQAKKAMAWKVFQCSDCTALLAWLAGHLGVEMDFVRIKTGGDRVWTRYLRVPTGVPGSTTEFGFPDVQYFVPLSRLLPQCLKKGQSGAGMGTALNPGHRWAQYPFNYHHVAGLRSTGNTFVFDAGSRFDRNNSPATDATVNPDFYFNQANVNDEPKSDLSNFLLNHARAEQKNWVLPLPATFLAGILDDYALRSPPPAVSQGGMELNTFVDNLVYLRTVRGSVGSAVGYDTQPDPAVETFKILP